MTRLPFWKLQSIGNDFPTVHLEDIVAHLQGPVLEAPTVPVPSPVDIGSAPEATPMSITDVLTVSTPAEVPKPSDFDVTEYLAKLSLSICDRHFGVGGDGLLAMGMEDGAVRLRMFNPDGTEDFCGNGIRCAAIHAHALGWVSEEFVVRHLDREIQTKIVDGQVSTVIGLASYDPNKVPHKGFNELFDATVWNGIDSGHPMSLFGSALTTGSTHVIIPTIKIPGDDSFESVSAKIEVSPLFPQRTSVIWAQEVVPDRLLIRIWERGVGETLGCGTGASAAAVDYLRRKNRGGTVEVTSRGGTLKVEMTAWDQPITLTGTAETVYSGEYFFASH